MCLVWKKKTQEFEPCVHQKNYCNCRELLKIPGYPLLVCKISERHQQSKQVHARKLFFRHQRSRPGVFLSAWFAVHSPIYLWELDSYGCCVKKSQPCMSQDMPAQLKNLSTVVNKLNCQSPPHWNKAFRISRGGD